MIFPCAGAESVPGAEPLGRVFVWCGAQIGGKRAAGGLPCCPCISQSLHGGDPTERLAFPLPLAILATMAGTAFQTVKIAVSARDVEMEVSLDPR
jgi:hypothetical protein